MIKNAIVTQFPKTTPVSVLDSEVGIFLIDVESAQLLDIRFSFPAEVVQYCTANYLMLTPGEFI